MEVESTGQWFAREADQEDSDEGPNSHESANRPRRVAEFRNNLEYAVKEDEDGEFGEGDGDDVE